MTEEQLKKIAPVKPDKIKLYLPLINELNMPKERLCCFLAQILHESACFHYTKEIYSGAKYDVGDLAKRLGNTPEDDDDGEKYKGRGLIQVTGRANYLLCSKYLFGDDRLLNNPELLEQPEYAFKSALWFWEYKKLNTICDYPDDWTIRLKSGRVYNKFQFLTLKINGGQNGYKERLQYYQKAKSVL